jgi:transketolase
VGPTTVWDGLDQAAWACAAGMALHGGLLPVLRCTRRQAALAGPALRLVAQKSARLLQIVAADEDDEELPPVPTGAGILTPYDSAEALDCLVLALRQPASPSILVLPPPLSLSMPPGHRLSARGGYLVHDADRRDVTLLVAGAFMAVAAAVRTALVAQGLDAALVSIPSRSLFAAQDATYQGMVLGSALRVYFGGAVRFAGLAGLADMVVEPNPTEDTARLVHRIRARLDAAAAMLEAS